jgi:Flp pilus assembly protein TadG
LDFSTGGFRPIPVARVLSAFFGVGGPLCEGTGSRGSATRFKDHEDTTVPIRPPTRNRRDRQGGNAIVEFSLMIPWIVFLFVGILDFGFYSYAAIATQNAARAAAIQLSADQLSQTNTIACSAAMGELQGLPNMAGVTCATSAASVTDAQPFAVCFGTLTNTPSSPCGAPSVACADCSGATPPGGFAAANPFASPSSVQAVVTYRTLPMIPIPGVLTGQMQLSRIAEARIIQR